MMRRGGSVRGTLTHTPTLPTRHRQPQVLRVQKMINDEPSDALGGKMTRSQALFGHLNLGVLQPPAAVIAELLGFTR